MIFTPQEIPTERHMFYLACKDCKKKVTNEAESFHCERCSKTFDEAVPTYNFSVKVSDMSGTEIVQCMGDIGEAFMGMSCTEFYQIRDDLEQIKAQAQDCMMKKHFTLTIRARLDDSTWA